mgnify:CR=1 FL=1
MDARGVHAHVHVCTHARAQRTNARVYAHNGLARTCAHTRTRTHAHTHTHAYTHCTPHPTPPPQSSTQPNQVALDNHPQDNNAWGYQGGYQPNSAFGGAQQQQGAWSQQPQQTGEVFDLAAFEQQQQQQQPNGYSY